MPGRASFSLLLARFAKFRTLPNMLQLNTMDGLNTMVTHYAILIGIDDYPVKPLMSCVNDVQATKKFLRSKLKDSIKIWTLTASKTDRKSHNPVQDLTLCPTSENVTSACENVISISKAGNYVYIHYSGHGTQELQPGESLKKSTDDVALVLLSGEKENGPQYFRGDRLASLLRRMVDKRLVVTLILDCCFSASIYRRDEPDVRFLPYNSEFDLDHPLNPKKNLEDGMYRDISWQLKWLTNPDGYAILTACGPNEEAAACRFDGVKHGALSYYILKTIEFAGLTKRHGDIYDHLRAKFKGSILRQTPFLYGNRNQGFFGQVNSDIIEAAIPILLREGGTLELQAGHAHGVEIKDRLVLCPLDCSGGDHRSKGHSVVVKVVGTRALTSDLERLELPSAIKVRTGWLARPLTQYSLQRFPIRLASEIPYRDEWLTALRERSLDVYIDSENHSFAIDVVLNEGKYEIPNEEGYEIIDLTSIPQDQTGIGQVGSILEHLARFRLVRDLLNKTLTDPFRESFEVQIISNGKPFGPDYLIEIEHNAIAELIIENRGDKDLYISVYNLGPCWQVENAYHGTNIVVRPQSNRQLNKPTRKKLKMMIPKQMREKGYYSCKDILKVFATSQKTSFDLLELPRLGERAKTPAGDRTGQERGNRLENWAALNFPILTSYRKNTSMQ